MGLTQLIVLSVVQGITEFLPISSSGHLVLVPGFLGWSDQGLAFDVAVHFGSLIAVCVFFRYDLAALFRGAGDVIRGDSASAGARMFWNIGIATIPAAVAGLAFGSWIAEHLRDPAVVVATLSGYGILMALADRYSPDRRNITDLGIRDALIIGFAQALALVPGTSRSGITITAGRILGVARQDAARFSFLLSAPVILLAAIYEGTKLAAGPVAVEWGALGLAVLISAVVAYISIEFFMRVVSAIGLAPFAIYRVLLAGVIVYVLLQG